MVKMHEASHTSPLIEKAGNALLFLLFLVVTLDPANQVIHVKDYVFVLFVAFNAVVYKPRFDYLPFILLPYMALVGSFVSAQILGNMIDEEFFFGMAKGFSMLVLLLWVPFYYRLELMSKWVIFILALVASVLFLAVLSSELIEAGVFAYVQSHGKFIMMTRRSFLGISFFGMYYKSIICAVIPLYLLCHQVFIRGSHRVAGCIAIAVIVFAFATSGTRATMLLPLAMIGFAVFQKMQTTRLMRFFIYPFLALAALGFVVLVVKLATEKGETSNMIKYGHLASYNDLFFHHPEYLFMGQGMGSWFYSVGFRGSVTQTEWTYIELFRTCGLYSLFVLLMMLYPLWMLRHNLRQTEVAGVACAYVMFVLIAGTNPLLISSTGMTVMLMIYSYAHRHRQRTDGLLSTPQSSTFNSPAP